MTATPMPVPPTPTFLPPGTPVFTIPSTYSLWTAAPWAIQSWNELGAARMVIQAIILIAVLIIVAYILMRFGRDFSQKGADG